MGVVLPKYEGSSDYKVIGFPFIMPSGVGDGRFQVKGIDDIRFRLVSYQGFEIGPVVGWRFGRDEEDSNRLTGLGNVDGGLVVGAYGAYRMGILAAFVSYNQQVTGDDTGALVRFGLEAKSKVSPWLTLTGVVGSTYASSDYMDSYFTVTPVQSIRSGLTTYSAGAGIKDVYLGLGAEIPLDQRWTLNLNGRYTELVGDAADSPIVESTSQFTGSLSLSYKFSFGN